jgi:hypothetical protein
VRPFLAAAFLHHRLAATSCALLTGVLAVVASFAAPDLYLADSATLVNEPLIVHWLANPAARVPESRAELTDIQELLLSREKLVATVKRTGLMDHWDDGRPWALRQKDRLMALLKGPVSDEDKLEALVKMLERRLHVRVDGSKVLISAEWGTPQLAVAIVESQVGALAQLRVQREMKAVEAAALALDDQYGAVKLEMDARVLRIEQASKAGAWSVLDRETQQLERDQRRASELMVEAEQKHIAAEVFRSSNALRFVQLTKPHAEKAPMGLGLPVRIAVGAIAALLAALVCAAVLALTGGRILTHGQLEGELGLRVLGSLSLGGGGLIVRPSRMALVFLSGVAALTGVAIGFSHGDPLVSWLAPLSVIGAWLLWTRPLKAPMLILLFLALTLDDPTGRPYYQVWESPSFELGRIFFTNVAFFTGFEICVYALTLLMMVRRVFGRQHLFGSLDPVRGQAPIPLQGALVLSAGVIGWLIVWGVMRGGDFREALWQFRALLLMPCVAMLMLFALKLPEDLPHLLGTLIAGSIVKSLFGIYFIYAIASPRGIDPPHTTGHHDSMIFVTSVVTAVAMIWEKPSRRTLGIALLWLPFIAMALRFNDRRVAYVEIAMAFGLIYLLSPMQPMKRFVTRVAIMLMPVVALYFAVGWNQKGGVFAPVYKVKSIIAPDAATEEESSNAERDTENYNIMTTWKENMFLGQGFGHAFHEFSPSNDFGQSNFGHIGHNSVLWVMWIGGVVGFTGVFGYLIVAIYFLGRTLRLARDWKDRAALLVSLSIITTYLLQAFGDMGTQSALIDFCVACAIAVIGRLATRWGVWRNQIAEVALPEGLAPV